MAVSADRLRSVVMEALRRDFGSQWLGLTQAVAWVAIERGIYVVPQDTRIVQLDPEDEPPFRCRTEVESEMGHECERRRLVGVLTIPR